MVRFATWNILHAMDYRTGLVDLDRVAETLSAVAADVVALQEVDRNQHRSAGVDQTAELAARLGYRGFFSPSLIGDPDASWQAAPAQDSGAPAYGIALLSRFGLTSVRRLRLRGGGDGTRAPKATPTRPGWDHEPRWALQAKVPLKHVSVTVTCTHLSYMPWRGIGQFLRVLASAAGDHPAVVLGDLNLPQPLVRSLAPRWTYAGGAKSHPADAPRLQLDHVLLRGFRVVETTLGPPSASDHLPVVVEAELCAD
jgi:endonuclease/exonuclease/phosphatase family metal-dependent hydrolase